MKITRKISRTAITLAGALALGAATVGFTALSGAPAIAQQQVEVWKSPGCSCCERWVGHMRRAGFAVTVREVEDVQPVKTRNGVPDSLGSCHTAKVGGYVVEGHVPAQDVRRLLAERPDATGVAAPGMPADAPGMDMATGEAYEVVLFGGTGGNKIFARH